MRFSLADQDSSISNLTRELGKKSHFKQLILKLGERGIVSVNRTKKQKNNKKKDKTNAFALPSFTSKVVDSTGTGDALLSYATLSLIQTKSLVASSILGSIAAACECEKDGNISIKPDEILVKINQIQSSTTYKVQR